MKAKITCFGLALLLCALHVGRAQEPKPEDILKRVVEVYKGITSYQDTATMKMQMKMMGMDVAMDLSSSIALVKPDKVNMSLKINVLGNSNDINVVSDGKMMWTSTSNPKQYTEQPAPKSLAEAARTLGGSQRGDGMMGGISPGAALYGIMLTEDGQKMITEGVNNLKLVGSEEVNGKATYVLTWEVMPRDMGDAGKDAPVPLPQEFKDIKLPIKAWVSKDDSVIVQMSVDMSPMLKMVFSMFGDMAANLGGEMKEADKQKLEQLKAAMKDVQMTLVETHNDIKINGSIPDETFTFKPPADAKKVDQLDMGGLMKDMPFPGMPGMETKTDEKPSLLLGKPAPDFALKDRTGKIVKLSQFRGKPVLLNFWAEF